MKTDLHKKLLSLLTASTLGLSLMPGITLAAAGEETPVKASFVNVGEDGEDYINLCVPRSFQVTVPVDLTLEEAQKVAQTVEWTFDYDESQGYLDPALYPYHIEGGTLDSFTAMNGEALFSTPVTTAATVDGQVCLTAAFDSYVYFYNSSKNAVGETVYTPDYSVRHSNGGSYMDICGWYDLNAVADGEILGGVQGVKITPYDQFHTMDELYEAIDAVVDFAAENTDLYVVKESMGMSQGDNGLKSLDMPYLIIAKDKSAVDNWKKLKAQAEADPAAVLAKLEKGSLGDFQVPVLYSNVHANETAAVDGVMKFAWMLVEAAASESGTTEYKDLTGFTAEGEAALKEQLGPVGVEGSIAVPDLVADKSTYLGFLKGTGDGSAKSGTASAWDNSTVIDLEKYYDVETVTVDMDALLDDVFFLIVPEENVEGRTYLTRTSSGGFDLNRDNSFQTQAETQNMAHFIAQWNPVSFAEFHGRGTNFQFEPCDPPHEPNFEYDLLSEHLMTGGEALAIAAVANNPSYNSYSIPQRDYLSYTGEKTADGAPQTEWTDPWDDMSTSYTPQYAMLHGTVAYTVEMAAYNDDCATAVAYGMLGQSKYIGDNKAGYLSCQTQIFQRGVTNANSDAFELVGQWFTDVYDVEGAEKDIFRPEYTGEGQNGNFYPECYIIPLDGEHQSNLKAAGEMLEYLERNGVIVSVTDKAVTYNGVEYPAGTAVVSMYQAKRSVANGVLYDGTLITGWPVLYSEGITAFDKTRGFDAIVCAEPEAYQAIAAALGEGSWLVASQLLGESGTANVILPNTSEDTVAAVNSLLQSGKKVSVITAGDYKGSFLISASDWEAIKDAYTVVGVAVQGNISAKALTKAPVIYISGKPADATSGFVKATLTSGAYEYNYDRQAMETLGFTVTEDAAQADLIIGAAALDAAALSAIQSGTPYIGYGRRAIPTATKLFPEGALVRNTVSPSSMDVLAYVTYESDSMITASYVSEGDDILYGYGAAYFSAIPQGAQALIKIDGSKEPLEGFLCADGAHYDDFLNGSVQAIAYQGKDVEGNDIDVTLFANTLTNKVHQRDEYGFIANAAFAAVTASFTDVSDTAWYSDTVDAIVTAGLMKGTSGTTFAPLGTIDRATLVTTLYRMAGSPTVTGEIPFADVAEGTWYTEAVIWASEQGITNGTGTGFQPNRALTKEETATMLCRYAAGSAEGDNLAAFDDGSQVSGYAQQAVNGAAGAGILSGNGSGKLEPQKTATRVELASMLLKMG